MHHQFVLKAMNFTHTKLICLSLHVRGNFQNVEHLVRLKNRYI